MKLLRNFKDSNHQKNHWFIWINDFFVNLKWQSNKSLERTNLAKYFDNHIKDNQEEFKQQLSKWYKLFEYSLDKNLVSFT